jgi:hypothetical protein
MDDLAGLSHSARLRAAARRYGERELAERAASLLATGHEEVEFLRYVGGPGGQSAVEGRFPQYFANSWGARVLERYWVDSATSAVLGGLSHDAWRVRMVCARVCAIQQLGVPERVAMLTGDENWRVRDAAAWALGLTGEIEQAPALARLLDDEHPRVRNRAHQALDELSSRLDRPIEDLLVDC